MLFIPRSIQRQLLLRSTPKSRDDLEDPVSINDVPNLQDHAGVKTDGPTRLFFPNGIELISALVKVGGLQLE